MAGSLRDSKMVRHTGAAMAPRKIRRSGYRSYWNQARGPVAFTVILALFFLLIVASSFSGIPLWISDALVVAAFLLFPLGLAVACIRGGLFKGRHLLQPHHVTSRRRTLRIQSIIAGGICAAALVIAILIGAVYGIVFCLGGGAVTVGIYMANRD